MKCQRCKFENIPGQSTCVKCGSVLQISSMATEIYPPRMPKWERPFRNFLRSIRKNRTVAFINTKLHTPEWLKDILDDNAIGLFLCLVPGLAHLISGRFKEIRWYFAAWLVLLLTGLFLFGSFIGYICIGLAVGVHVGITIQYGLFKDLDNFREKVAIAFLLVLGMILVYRFVPRVLFPFVSGSRSTLTIPYYDVTEGDYLLVRPIMDREAVLARGSLVKIHPVTIGGYQAVATRNLDTIVAEVVGLPGENVRIIGDTFLINDRPLNIEQYPVPGWMRRKSFSAMIPKDNYFISARYNVAGYGLPIENSHIRKICMVHKSDIEGKAFMRWFPLAKRGFIK
jgi:hypothetical protein